jgi:hypothetical protein
MNYTLHQLYVFLVTQNKSITKSCRVASTQPAVSIQLKNFQDQFEFPIGRKLYVTDFGKEIAIAAEKF